MPTISLDLRQRILECYDRGEGTQQDVADRFCVSRGMIKKLLAQRARIGDIAPQHHRSGRKPKLVGKHRRQLRSLLHKTPDLTLAELRTHLDVDCTLPAIHYVLAAMGMTYKKRRSAPANRTGPTSVKSARPGGASSAASTLPG